MEEAPSRNSRAKRGGRPNAQPMELADDLLVPFREFGHRWNLIRPKPTEDALKKWDGFLASWISSTLPLIIRKRLAGSRHVCRSGRVVFHADNTPAHWAYELALAGQVPNLELWTQETFEQVVPMKFIERRQSPSSSLNALGYKVCHIQRVGDGRRLTVQEMDADDIHTRFLRFMSPRNMFVVPKSRSEKK